MNAYLVPTPSSTYPKVPCPWALDTYSMVIMKLHVTEKVLTVRLILSLLSDKPDDGLLYMLILHHFHCSALEAVLEGSVGAPSSVLFQDISWKYPHHAVQDSRSLGGSNSALIHVRTLQKSCNYNNNTSSCARFARTTTWAC